MVTKAIIEEIVTSNEVKVRMPVYDKIASNGTGTGTDNEAIASICCFPNVNLSVSVGDTVFVGFEDNNRQKPVVLGYLNTDEAKRYVSASTRSLNSRNRTILSKDTSIGDITYSEIEHLKNIDTNIQEYVKTLNELRDKILEKIEIGEEKNSEIDAKLLEESERCEKIIEYIDYINDLIGSDQDDSDDKTVFGQINYTKKVVEVISHKIGNISEGESIMSLLNAIQTKVEELEGSYSNGYGTA